MIKQLAWNTFKNTGSIDTFLELVEMRNIEENITGYVNNNMKEELENGDNQNKRDNYFGK